ncbi:hypothetical protein H4R33_004334 [Dimargaris cristalligena]|nr:hypothetical protein H4R33_004334 [Dimargaris cristalligena]
MVLANFGFGLPHGIESVGIVTGSQASPQLIRRSQGQGQSLSASQASPNNNQHMQATVSQMDKVKTEADFSFFLTTTSLSMQDGNSSGTGNTRLKPTLSSLRTNFAELEEWSQNFDQVRTDDIDANTFHVLFPLVAQILDDGPSAIVMLDALPMGVGAPGFRRDYYTVASEFPGLGRTTLPEDLAQHTLSHISNLAKAHLAAHYVLEDNVEGLKEIIRSWIAQDRQATPTRPPTDIAANSDEQYDVPELDHVTSDDDDSMDESGFPSDEDGDSMADDDESMADEDDDFMTDEDDYPEFNPNDHSPLDTLGPQGLQTSKYRRFIATVYMWASEHGVSDFDDLLTEFGNPFRKSDLPCFLAFDYDLALVRFNTEYSDQSLILSPYEQFLCYQNFSFQGYVTMSPHGVMGDKEIRVRYNRKLDPRVTAVPDDDSQILDGIVGDLNTLMSQIHYKRAWDHIVYRLNIIHPWATSLRNVIGHANTIASSRSTDSSQHTDQDSLGPTSTPSENLLPKIEVVIETMSRLMGSTENINSSHGPLSNTADTGVSTTNAGAGNNSEARNFGIADDILVRISRGLQLLLEKHTFRASTEEGLSNIRGLTSA